MTNHSTRLDHWPQSWAYSADQARPSISLDQVAYRHRLETIQDARSVSQLSTSTEQPPPGSHDAASTWATTGEPNVSSQYSAWKSFDADSAGQPEPVGRRFHASIESGRVVDNSTLPPGPNASTLAYEVDDEHEVDAEDTEMRSSDPELDGDLQNAPMTVAELRAHNRRLKRFRQVVHSYGQVWLH